MKRVGVPRVAQIVWILLSLMTVCLCHAQSRATHKETPVPSVLRVAVAGSEPFVVRSGNAYAGISVEVWQALADHTGLRYHFQQYGSVPEALTALQDGAVDVVVGPVSVTASRANKVAFSQPYYQSILSGMSSPSV